MNIYICYEKNLTEEEEVLINSIWQLKNNFSDIFKHKKLEFVFRICDIDTENLQTQLFKQSATDIAKQIGYAAINGDEFECSDCKYKIKFRSRKQLLNYISNLIEKEDRDQTCHSCRKKELKTVFEEILNENIKIPTTDNFTKLSIIEILSLLKFYEIAAHEKSTTLYSKKIRNITGNFDYDASLIQKLLSRKLISQLDEQKISLIPLVKSNYTITTHADGRPFITHNQDKIKIERTYIDSIFKLGLLFQDLSISENIKSINDLIFNDNTLVIRNIEDTQELLTLIYFSKLYKLVIKLSKVWSVPLEFNEALKSSLEFLAWNFKLSQSCYLLQNTMKKTASYLNANGFDDNNTNRYIFSSNLNQILNYLEFHKKPPYDNPLYRTYYYSANKEASFIEELLTQNLKLDPKVFEKHSGQSLTEYLLKTKKLALPKI